MSVETRRRLIGAIVVGMTATLSMTPAARAAEKHSRADRERAIELVDQLRDGNERKLVRRMSARDRALVVWALTPARTEGAETCSEDPEEPTTVATCYFSFAPVADADAEAPTPDAGAAESLQAGSGCRVPRKAPRLRDYSAVGILLWSYFLDANWCWSGRKITSFSAQPVPLVHAPLWNFEKHEINRTVIDPSGEALWRQKQAQGHFQFCMTKIGCVKNKFPYIKMTVVKDGHGWSAVGN